MSAEQITSSRQEQLAPMGATWLDEENGYQFILYSRFAQTVVLLLYSDSDAVNPMFRIPLRYPAHKTSRYWHIRIRVTDVPGAKYYAWQVFGPNDPSNGYRFDSDKVLLDPYAVGVYFPPGHDRGAACRPGSNAGKSPIGFLPAQTAPTSVQRQPAPRHGSDLVIYEMHVRGFTKDVSSGVAAAHRGTYAGLIERVPYLKELGITAVELMPVHQFDPQEGNFWGYMTLNFFTPHCQYAVNPEVTKALDEFRNMVDALHAAEIEVILDVVYNHTTEAGADGPTYSYRGIDNTTYYALTGANHDQYANFSACGNDLRTAHAVVRRLVMDSLRFWASNMGVDGFRFDLASILARNERGELELEDPPLISEMSSDPTLSGVRLIAEPWQGAYGGGYLMGQVFPGKTWGQWNDHFRDCVRSFIKGDSGRVSDLMTRVYGSADLFPEDEINAFRRYQSINYVDSHDGLCMYDLVAYTNDGQQSWDCGYHGDAGVPQDVLALRKQQVKNFCTLLLLSNGVPMFCAGDEFMRTQGGEVNPWNQDNSTTWLDWTFQRRNADVFRFFQLMIAFRKEHPTLARSEGWRDHVRWHGVGPDPDQSADSHVLAWHLGGSDIGDSDIYVMVNAWWQPLSFAIQENGAWRRVVDTSLPCGQDIVSTQTALPVGAPSYIVAARSIVVLIK